MKKDYPVYPIYTASIKFSQDTDPTLNLNMNKDGLPEGREWNVLWLHNIMLKEKNFDVVMEKVNKTWEFNKPNYKNVSDVSFDVKYWKDEEWCLTWFAHWTFDIGQSDIDCLNSFDDFVYRMNSYNRENQEVRQYSDGTNYLWEPYCLMGAEDRWRWKGDPTQEDSPPPCRCKFCKEKGALTIGH